LFLAPFAAASLFGALFVMNGVEQIPAECVRDLGRGGKTVVLVGTDAGVMGAIAVADTVRAEARETVQALRSDGIKVVMLTGDNASAWAIAEELGVDKWQAELLPQQKVEQIMGDDLARLPYLFRLSKTARRVIRQNVWTSILIKLGLELGVFPALVSLAVAVLVGEMGTSLGIAGNTLRLSRVNP
jgi:Cd2+/Zn2+-exporting ATPase